MATNAPTPHSSDARSEEQVLTFNRHPLAGRPVTVEYVPEALAESQTHPPTWLCPYDGCIGTNQMGGVRTIVSVSTGHAPNPSPL